MAMPSPEAPEPRDWPQTILIVLFVCIVLGALVGMFVGGWRSLSEHMNDRINQRPTPTVSTR